MLKASTRHYWSMVAGAFVATCAATLYTAVWLGTTAEKANAPAGGTTVVLTSIGAFAPILISPVFLGSLLLSYLMKTPKAPLHRFLIGFLLGVLYIAVIYWMTFKYGF